MNGVAIFVISSAFSNFQKLVLHFHYAAMQFQLHSPLTRGAMYTLVCPRSSDADWCLQPDGVLESRLQAS